MRTYILRVLAMVAMLATLLLPSVASATEPSFNHPNFGETWKKDDLAVMNGKAKSWTWGPAVAQATDFQSEPYNEAPDGFRAVQYFDKSRMEDASYRESGDWKVTNGLLVVEMVTGQMQLGDSLFAGCTPADIPVAGDMNQEETLTYAMFYNDIAPGQHQWAPEFQDFMSRDNATYKVGLASSPAWWTEATVGGVTKQVLVQLGERRALTYTPDNPPGWQVEWGNTGQHYFQWRYGPGGCASVLDPDHGPDPDQPMLDMGDGWTKVVIAGDGDRCSWQFQFRAEVQDGATVDFPHCGEMRFMGTGIVKVEVRPDFEGYADSEHLTWWGQGEDDSGQFSVLKRNGEWTGWITPSHAGDGIDFARDGGDRRFEAQATGGMISVIIGPGIGKL